MSDKTKITISSNTSPSGRLGGAPSIKIAGAQGFYGDSPSAAIQIAKENGADYLVIDSLAELTLSILQKDKLKDEALGYARDIESMAYTLFPIAFKNGLKIVTNSGGLNPEIAAKKVAALLEKQGIKGIKIAIITGDNLLAHLQEMQQSGLALENIDNGAPFSSSTFEITHANVYTGAHSIAEALDNGANLILAGRVADPCLTLGILIHHFKWRLTPPSTSLRTGTPSQLGEGSSDLSQTDLDKLASGIAVGHLLECGGQASGGNSYAEWPMDYSISNLGYPIAEVFEDGTALFSKLESQGGKVSRNTIREQLIYEIHDPANYITPDVIVDFTSVKIEELSQNKVHFSGIKGKPRPEKLKLSIGQMEGYMSDQFFFFSWPYAYEKATRFIETVKEIWAKLPVKIERSELSLVGINGIHGTAAPLPPKETLDEINEIGVRLAIKHNDLRTGKLCMQSVICLGLNGPPGLIGVPGWGKTDRIMLSLWPTLIPREWVKEKVEIIES